MGVKGLWRLLAPTGKTISLESLEGKILAVDVSIWLNKAAKGMRDKHGNNIYNAHLVLIFQRICKLLFYGVKPVFVFDGAAPELKKKTLKTRRERRSKAETKSSKTKDHMLQNYLKTKALEVVTGTKSSYKLNLKGKKEPDLFELPSSPLPTDKPLNAPGHSQSESSSDDDDMLNEEEWLKTLNESHIQAMFEKPDQVDIDSEEFISLPAEVKHELLTEIKNSHRRRYRQKDEIAVQLPEEADDFSSYQLDNLQKRGRITQQIDQLRKDMNNSMTAQFIQLHSEQFDKISTNFKTKHVESKQYASNEKQRYILIRKEKGTKTEENVLFQTSLDDDYIRFRQREEDIVDDLNVFRRLERPAAKFRILAEETAKRKRFGSDSSDDLTENLEGVKRQRSAIVDTTCQPVERNEIKDNVVEFMSSGSSSSSEGEEEKDLESRIETSIVKLAAANEIESVQKKSTELVVLTAVDEIVPDEITPSVCSSNDLSREKQSPGVSKTKHEQESTLIASTSDVAKEDSNIAHPEDDHLGIYPSRDLPPQIIADENSLLSPSSLMPLNIMTPTKSIDVSPKPVADGNRLSSPTSPTPNNIMTPTDENDFSLEGEQLALSYDSIETREPIAKSKEEAIELQEKLREEQVRLEEDKQKQTRHAATLTSEMYQDVQELLQLFGLPYLVSPTEAEAQCAQLDYSNLTDGSITDDSDVFLFGARRVYKNIFNQKKFAELYLSKQIERTLYLTREKLIAIAFLSGSDYTEGVQGVGGVTAMEILHEFSKKKAKETLKFFKEWVKSAGSHEFKPGSNLKSKLRDVDLPRSFNSSSVWEAYLSPSVDTSDEDFEWGEPDVTAVKEFASEKFGWLYSRTNEMLLPVLERVKTRKQKQKTLREYFKPSIKLEDNDVIQSKRLKKILQNISAKSGPQNDDTNSNNAKDKMADSTASESLLENEPSYFDDVSIESELFDIGTGDGRLLTKQPSKPSIKPLITSSRSVSNKATSSPRNPCRERLLLAKPLSSNSSCTISSSEKVQAKKVENLIKAAATSLKPVSPFVHMRNVNNIVRNRMLGQRHQMSARGRKQRQKTTASLLEQAEALKSSELKPLQSSESDSD